MLLFNRTHEQKMADEECFLEDMDNTRAINLSDNVDCYKDLGLSSSEVLTQIHFNGNDRIIVRKKTRHVLYGLIISYIRR